MIHLNVKKNKKLNKYYCFMKFFYLNVFLFYENINLIILLITISILFYDKFKRKI